MKFLGPLSHEEVFQYLDNVDIYIQPSKQEGLPRALVEAMSRGCPALGSKTGGIPELLNKDFIFQKGAVDEICALLERLDKETMYEEAIRNFEKAKEFDRDLLERRRTLSTNCLLDKVFNDTHRFSASRQATRHDTSILQFRIR